MNMQIIDHGQNDPIEMDLSGFHAVAHGIRKHTRSGQAAPALTVREAVTVLRHRNAWNRDDSGVVLPPDHAKVNEAIDLLCLLADGLQVVA
jgi:hypothetical protein